MSTLTFGNPLMLLLLPLVLGWVAWLWLRDRGGYSRARHRLALALRLLIMGALILVLSGATWQQAEARQATVFVADLSSSVSGVRDREISFIAHALRARGRDDVASVVAVGGDTLVEQSFGALGDFAGFQSVVDAGATNLEAGLNLAAALFPSGYRKRVVLLTDGRQTTGDALAAARLLRDEGTRLDVVPLRPRAGVEALVDGVEAPTSLHRGALVPLTVTLRSTVAQDAALDIFDGDRLLRRVSLRLPAGVTSPRLTVPALDPGFHRLHVVLHPAGDTVADNNQGDVVTNVMGSPRVLLAEGLPGEGSVVAAALRSKGMRVQEELATAIEPSTAYLSQFDAVVLVDAPALEFDNSLLDPSRSPVRSYVDGGGGLVVIGGPNSYGVGGYTGTTFDDLLPVSMKLPQRRDTPSVAVALIVESLESDVNVNIAKAAAEGVLNLLTPHDRVAVSAAPDTLVGGNGDWAVGLQYVVNKVAINHAIDAMTPNDPLSYKPALIAAFNTLRQANARIKHIILLGDGDAEDTYRPLISRIRGAGMTVSTVATGGGQGGFGADYGTMRAIAHWGGGRYYQADDVHSIPTIFLTETKAIARTGVVEGRFMPEIVSDSPVILGVPAAPLYGYVATTPKPAGEQVLMHVTAHGLDPILAQWQYGLGHVVAWTSDTQARWARALVSTGQGNRLWANMVSWTLPSEASPNLTFASSTSGGRAHVSVSASGLPLSTQITARISGPGRAATLTLSPSAPGQYDGDMSLPGPGAYVVGIRAVADGRLRASLRTAFVEPYAPEYRAMGLDARLVAQAAAVGGGSVLKDPADSFADNVPPVYAPLPLTTPLLLLALLLLPFDVATRRLLVSLSDVRDWIAVPARRRMVGAAVGPVGAASAPLSTVRARRATRRIRGATSGAPDAPPVAAPAHAATYTARVSPSTVARAAPGPMRDGHGGTSPDASSTGVPPASPPSPRPPSAASPTADRQSDATTSRLLAAKRRRRGG